MRGSCWFQIYKTYLCPILSGTIRPFLHSGSLSVISYSCNQDFQRKIGYFLKHWMKKWSFFSNLPEFDSYTYTFKIRKYVLTRNRGTAFLSNLEGRSSCCLQNIVMYPNRQKYTTTSTKINYFQCCHGGDWRWQTCQKGRKTGLP